MLAFTLHSRPAKSFQQGQLMDNPRMPWDAVFAYMAHHADKLWEEEVERQAFQFITRGSSPSLLAPMVTLSGAHALQNLASANSARW